MEIKKLQEIFRKLINKVYNSTKIDDELLKEIEEDLANAAKIIKETQYSRELSLFIETIKKEKIQIK